ncbi:LCP family protein [Nocardiopsis sp. CNT312]|uniref:LCP family protein n=1 Tax=Nocardiopsis sp. CNT312 TaxID=1137268 RepID=UPI0004B8302A
MARRTLSPFTAPGAGAGPARWAALTVAAVLVVAGLVAYLGYAALGVRTEEVDTDAWGDRPVRIEGMRTVLVLGTDERAPEHAAYSREHGVRPDVLVLVGVDIDRGAVTMVNLPRDLIVDLPPCPAARGYGGWPGGQDQINHALRYGGLDCQGRTVESVTGVHLDHMVAVDFAAFERMVDTLGGVTLCVPEPIDDPGAELRLDPGEQELDGRQALGLARSRASTEFGSDLGRIRTQQRLIGALLREVTEGEVMSSPAALYAFVDTVTDHMVTDDRLTVKAMAELAAAMRGTDLSRMTTVTAPVRDHPWNPNKVVLDEPAATALFTAVATGRALPGAGDTTPSAHSTPSGAPPAVPSQAPDGLPAGLEAVSADADTVSCQ